ncbi:MAG: FRG domain-containing protein [Porticoccaceae bacterium]
MRINTAESWLHLQELLFDESWNEELGRFRSSWAFRGLPNVNYPLDTTLMRLGGRYDQLERHLLRNFMKYAHRDVVERDSYWHWLSVAQHHGLPTRLLDWTHSPLVAAHFATADTTAYEADAVVWCVNYECCHKLLPERIRLALDREGANTFTTELLAGAVKSLDELDRLAGTAFLLFFEPPSMDDRIVNQYALFSVISSATQGLDLWMAAHGNLCRKIIIPAALKWEIRDKLDQANITERVLFPGLDGLSSWLRRHYSPTKQG